MFFVALVGLAWTAEFSSKPSYGREKFMEDLVANVSFPLSVDSVEELQDEMSRMTQESYWYPVEARWLGLKALDYPECGESSVVRMFFRRSCEFYGPVLIRDLVRYSDTFELMQWEPVLTEYFQDYRLRQMIGQLSEELVEAVEEAPTSCFHGAMVRLLSNLFLTDRSKYRIPSTYPIFDYHSAKISCFFHLTFFPKMEIYQRVFVNSIGLVEQLEVLNELDAKYDLGLESWIQTQPERIQQILKAIRQDFSVELLDAIMPRDLLKAFKRMRFVDLGNVDESGLSLLAFAFRRWPCNLIFEHYPPIRSTSATNLMWRNPHLKLFPGHLVFIAFTTLFWKYPELLWQHPKLIENLPEQMPPITALIPKSARISINHAYVFKLLSNRYGFETLKQAMEAEEYPDEMLFYLCISNGHSTIGLEIPTGMNEVEAEEWIALLHQ